VKAVSVTYNKSNVARGDGGVKSGATHISHIISILLKLSQLVWCDNGHLDEGLL
jgi:hypothetical protein